MTFLGRIWRLLVGIKDGLVLALMLIFFGGLYSLLSATPNAATAVQEGALYLELDGTLVEQPEQTNPQELLFGSTNRVHQYRLRDVVHVLDHAAGDPRIKVVALDLNRFMGGGQVAIQQVGAALDKVRKAGKPVLVYATGYADDSYLLAAHASEVWLDPMGGALISGPGGSRPYFKGLMDRLGVNVRVYRVGKYKSFVEPFIRADQSPEAREDSQALANALLTAWVADVKAARPQAQIEAYLKNPVPDTPTRSFSDQALKLKLVDKLGDDIRWAERVAQLAGRDPEAAADRFKGTDFTDYLAANPVPNGGEIGVITIAGNIVDGEAPAGSAGGDTISRLILDALTDKRLKALVVRVDSPGGSALASEKIRQALLQAKARKLPVIVSMGNVAASGGYWVSMAGDKVFAEPATITGSIGVFGLVPTFEKSAAKIGITADGVATTPLSGQPDILRGTNETTDRILQGGVDDIYRRFTSLVASQRRLPLARVNEIAQGRVWDGGTARQIGLVDAFGGIDAAIAEAARRAGLDAKTAKPVYLDRMPNWFELYLRNLREAGVQSAIPADPYSRLIWREQAAMVTGLQDGLMILSGPAIQVRCLSCPVPLRPVQKDGLIKALGDRFF
ncbi:MAG: signal peptide peptidase SppA [Chakrabartia sp.]